jgi:hypothetical protein
MRATRAALEAWDDRTAVGSRPPGAVVVERVGGRFACTRRPDA